MKYSKENNIDYVIRTINALILALFTLFALYPVYLVIISSISDPLFVNTGRVAFWPKGITMAGYEEILKYDDLWRGYFNTILYTAIHIVLSVSATIMGAYALSRKKLIFRSFFLKFVTITMFANGGIIPLFLVVRNIGLVDSIWSVILLNCVQVWNLLICRTFFENTIPTDLYDAASIDGANDLRVFTQIVIPLSKAIIVVMILYYGVIMWNDVYKSLIFLKTESKFPLQIILREILMQSRAAEDVLDMDFSEKAGSMDKSEIIKYSVIVVSSLPIITMYPFLQKYFVQGVMLGSVKS